LLCREKYYEKYKKSLKKAKNPTKNHFKLFIAKMMLIVHNIIIGTELISLILSFYQ